MSEQRSKPTGLYIAGEWITDTDESIVSKNPSNSDEVVAEVAKGDRSDAQDAVDAAVHAQDEWASLTTHERGSYLHETASIIEDRKEELSQLVVQEMGKTIGAASGELQRTIDLLNYYAEVARDAGGNAPPSASENTLTYTQREPWGTAGVITPWNYPIAIPTWKMAPALIAGNTVVFKPASQTPTIAAELVSAFEEAGLPEGVINFVPGSGSDVGDEITTNDDIDIVTFTGSYQVGDHVHTAASDEGKRVQCEMGGKNPIIVDDSADIDLAVELTINGGFTGLSGQACTATSRAIILESVYDEYIDRLIERVESLTVGDPLDESSDMGPKSSAGGLEGDLDYIEIGKEDGATLRTGGNRLEGDEYEDGYYVEPTVFTDVEPDMRIAQEEIFGPVLAVLEVADYDEAIEVANSVQYGLSASICTNRLDHAKQFVRDIETGIVKVNQTSTGVEMQMPFGGRKQSSTETFKEQGRQALDFYTHEKAVYVTHTE
ncbi:aldehyde dehydrogenase family protein [Halopenitus sp. H-Gu1]|uniref:aldehyde dehydrogenase family protein n=1 Tax=Halopenitus sp. H-Gu1 TaxID=3242697 RepID=UPI00359CFA5F